MLLLYLNLLFKLVQKLKKYFFLYIKTISQIFPSSISKYFHEKIYEIGGLVQISTYARGIGLMWKKHLNRVLLLGDWHLVFNPHSDLAYGNFCRCSLSFLWLISWLVYQTPIGQILSTIPWYKSTFYNYKLWNRSFLGNLQTCWYQNSFMWLLMKVFPKASIDAHKIFRWTSF